MMTLSKARRASLLDSYFATLVDIVAK